MLMTSVRVDGAGNLLRHLHFHVLTLNFHKLFKVVLLLITLFLGLWVLVFHTHRALTTNKELTQWWRWLTQGGIILLMMDGGSPLFSLNRIQKVVVFTKIKPQSRSGEHSHLFRVIISLHTISIT